MSDQSQNASRSKQQPERRSGTVAGIVITTADDSLETINRIHQARAEGYDVLVALAIDRSAELANIAQTTGAQVIRLDYDTDLDNESLRSALAFVASQEGYSQVVFPNHNGVDKSIDFTDTAALPIKKDRIIEKSSEDIIAIPAYNEVERISRVVEEARDYADCVLVIDDGSGDETATHAREAGATVVQHEYNRGYGAALKTAFDEAARRRASSLVIIDGDGQHNPSDIPMLHEKLEIQDVDIVIGSRFIDGVHTDISMVRRFGVWTVNLLTNASLGYLRRRDRITDTQSGFRAYSGRAIRSLSEDHDLEAQMGASTDILYHARKYGYDIEEVGISISYDVENPSSQHPVAHGVALVTNILRTSAYQHPLLSLGAPGLVSMLFGFLLILNYLNIGTEGITVVLLAAVCGWFGAVTVLTAAFIVVLKIHDGPNG